LIAFTIASSRDARSGEGVTGKTGLSKVAVGVVGGMNDVAPGIGVALGTGVGVISGVGSGTIVSSVGVSAITTVVTASVTSGVSVAQDTTSVGKITI
jgi:hypothetical protein